MNFGIGSARVAEAHVAEFNLSFDFSKNLSVGRVGRIDLGLAMNRSENLFGRAGRGGENGGKGGDLADDVGG